MKRALLAMALLVTSVFGVTGCGSDDEGQVTSRVKKTVPDASATSYGPSRGDCELLDRLNDGRLNDLDYRDVDNLATYGGATGNLVILLDPLDYLENPDLIALLDRLDRLDEFDLTELMSIMALLEILDECDATYWIRSAN